MNGFEARQVRARPDLHGRSVLDDRVDGRDAIFGRLLLWRDANHNGISETDELRAVAGSGLVAIGTDYTNMKRVDRHGDEFRQKGRLLWSDGTQDPAFDVWLVPRE